MTIRTISQLPSCGEDTDLNAFIEVSVPRTDKGPETPTGYVSKKQSFENIRNKLEGEIETSLISRFELQDGTNDIKVKSIKDRVTTLESGAITITGEKKFASAPVVENYEGQYGGSDAKKKLVTLGYVEDKVIPGITYDRISPDSTYVAAKGVTGFINDGNLMTWSIESGKQVSKEPAIVKQTGNLVMYGILADNGNVDGRTAWVGLFAEISGTEILISLQPWVIGQKSTIMQYVSFNLPVKAGLKLSIRTGFPVDGTNSMSQGSNSAMHGLNAVNSFVGYVIS